MSVSVEDLVKICFAIFLPVILRECSVLLLIAWRSVWRNVTDAVAYISVQPVCVALEKGIHKDFWINLLLTILGFLPGSIHALWIMLR